MKRFFFNRLYTYHFRKKLRTEATPAEKYLWYHLKNRKLKGQKFRRQSGLGNYIVDFYCPSAKLVIELDGAPHFNPLSEEKDIKRDLHLQRMGFKVLRFRNDEVFNDTENVLKKIAGYL
ncbi:endonuclease domain-containing protein [Robertkochia aurantiaca]|uniref:endonuclease domain-containing protein n=1 Tax=Robertkochia aurantiaca TaxID=2873700 RepID=UPI001CCC3A14|nr:endonuclease domain-containing protein [Robertkochia sp. 3YJGBD-33]